MKYLWLIGGFIFASVVIYNMIVSGKFDSINALWSMVMFLQYDVKDLQDKIKKVP